MSLPTGILRFWIPDNTNSRGAAPHTKKKRTQKKKPQKPKKPPNGSAWGNAPAGNPDLGLGLGHGEKKGEERRPISQATAGNRGVYVQRKARVKGGK